MPVYPCRNCKKSVDPVVDGFCKNCNEAYPFECSKCGTKMSPELIFDLHALTFQKPLFCLSCGEANKVVECKICGKTLVRSVGKITSINGIERVYHPACFDKQLKNVVMIRKYVTPALIILGAVVAYAYSPWMIPVGAAGGAGLAMGLAILFTPK
ncbi:MAG: hypothetical protein AB1758_09345 [Candidatus Eremiobacterota bacterium]